MPVLLYIFIGLACAYCVLMLYYRYGWKKQQPFGLNNDYKPHTAISVIIPARNEENNILTCVQAVLSQQYPQHLLEIIVVDDHSTDSTAQIVQTLNNLQVKLLQLANYITETDKIVAYKKLALSTGIAQSTGSLIVTTDADCYMGKYWLQHIAAIYEQSSAKMIVAPVNFTSNNTIVQLFQSLDFMTMQGITVASLQLKLGNMCNGANLAFEKEVYQNVGGYKGIDHLASGDDYLLMMKINNAYPKAIQYLYAKEAIVQTPPQPDWMNFFRQRVRWASKSGKYNDTRLTSVLLLVYLFNLMFLIILVSTIAAPTVFWQPLVLVFIAKVVVELFFLYPVATFFGKSHQLWIFPFLQPLHIIYVVAAGLLGFVGKYSWKGRSVK